MLVTHWLRSLYAPNAEILPAREVSSAAARGVNVEELLHVAVRELIDVGNADRAGVWISGANHVANWRGHVDERSGDPAPPEWTLLNPALSFLTGIIENGEPSVQNFSEHPGVETFGPMMGMGTALCLPLRLQGRRLGVALAAWRRAWYSPLIPPLQRIAEQLSVAIAQLNDAKVAKTRESELASLDQIQKAILKGESAVDDLRLILSHVKRYSGCVFAAFELEREGGFNCHLVEGSAGWQITVHEDPLREAWARSLTERRPVQVEGFSEPPSTMNSRAWVHPLSILAVPIQASTANSLANLSGTPGGETQSRLGVLVTGFIPGSEIPADRERLEACARLASLALQNHLQRQWEKETRMAHESSLAKTSEWILLVNESGAVCGGSKSALKKVAGSGSSGTQAYFQDLFTIETWPSIEKWRKAALSSPGEMLEGTLANGDVVQLRMRAAPYSSHLRPRWEILLEAPSVPEDGSRPGGSAEHELETLLDSIESGVLIFDAAGQVRMTNNRFSQFFGMDLRQMSAIDTREALAERLSGHSMDSEAFRARWLEIARTGDVASWDEFELMRPVRRVIERFTRPLIDPRGTRTGWLEVWRDVTASRLHLDKLQQIEKMAALGQLVSSIAHELNNPLTSIMGYAQLLLARTTGSDLNADLAKIHDEAERAARIIKNLLLLAREHTTVREQVDLNDIVQRTLALRAYELKLENITVACDLDPQLPLVLAEGGQMQQVFLNLILNAEQAIGLARGHGHIRIRTCKLAAKRVMLEVTDDGPGIPSAIAARIFDPFFTTKPAGIGTGLGLSIVTGIVQAHGGAIRLAGSSASGATFCIELPAMPPLLEVSNALPPLVPAARNDTPQKRVLPTSEARGKHLLVIEDEPTVAQLVADVLHAQGHRVTVVLDSREGLKLAEGQNFDLVICDLKMPHLDGRAFYHTLMRNGSRLLNRIIFVTGDTMATQTMEFLEAYNLPYVAKPFLVEELKEAVERAFRRPPEKARAATSSNATSGSGKPARQR